MVIGKWQGLGEWCGVIGGVVGLGGVGRVCCPGRWYWLRSGRRRLLTEEVGGAAEEVCDEVGIAVGVFV